MSSNITNTQSALIYLMVQLRGLKRNPKTENSIPAPDKIR